MIRLEKCLKILKTYDEQTFDKNNQTRYQMFTNTIQQYVHSFIKRANTNELLVCLQL